MTMSGYVACAALSQSYIYIAALLPQSPDFPSSTHSTTGKVTHSGWSKKAQDTDRPGESSSWSGQMRCEGQHWSRRAEGFGASRKAEEVGKAWS